MKAQGAYKILTFMPNIITAATISGFFYKLFDFLSSYSPDLRNRLLSTVSEYHTSADRRLRDKDAIKEKKAIKAAQKARKGAN